MGSISHPEGSARRRLQLCCSFSVLHSSISRLWCTNLERLGPDAIKCNADVDSQHVDAALGLIEMPFCFRKSTDIVRSTVGTTHRAHRGRSASPSRHREHRASP